MGRVRTEEKKLSLPSGRNEEGLPLGLQVVGGWHEDEALLHWAKGLEQGLQYER